MPDLHHTGRRDTLGPSGHYIKTEAMQELCSDSLFILCTILNSLKCNSKKLAVFFIKKITFMLACISKIRIRIRICGIPVFSTALNWHKKSNLI